MARPPAGPIGNSPRDVRDDAIGVPADDIKAPEPPRWPPKPKKITKNDFHAKVSGGASAKRADRKPHFRRGGFVKGFASGGSVENRREEKPGEDKNDPTAKQNLRGGGNVKKKASGGPVADYTEGPYTPGGKTVKKLSHFHPAHDFDPGTAMGSTGPKNDEAQTDEVGAERRMRDMRSGRDLRDNDWSQKEPGYPKREDRRFKGGGGVKKREDGGLISESSFKPPEMPDKPFAHTGSETPGPGLPEEEFPQKLARGINTINRTIGNAPNRGAIDVQKYADMKRAQQISDAVPRRREEGIAGPGGIGHRKSGGKIK